MNVGDEKWKEKIRDLGLHLDDLASSWWRNEGNLLKQEEIAKEYSETMDKMYALGWDGIVEIGRGLPFKFMPAEYRKRFPDYDENAIFDNLPVSPFGPPSGCIWLVNHLFPKKKVGKKEKTHSED